MTHPEEIAPVFHVGDKLIVRDWDDMLDEFGMDDDGAIQCRYEFCELMRPLCGKPFTVKSVKKTDYHRSFICKSEERYEDELLYPVLVSSDMLRLAHTYDHDFEPPSDINLLSLF